MKSGDSLGPYRILESLGRGGMGEVYAAEDTRLHRQVALKVLPPELEPDPERLRRFEREAQAIAALSHPNIVTLHTVEVAGDIRFLTMELVRGRTLDKLIPAGGMTTERFFRLAIPLAEAVAAAHRCGITHRDLKPANIMVDEDQQVKVLDFGLAKLREPERQHADPAARQTELTGDGRILGTPAYMSPEQAEGKLVDSRSDIFSLGVILYEMSTGKRPFNGTSPLSILTAILRDRPEPVTQLRRDLPAQFEGILGFCLAKEPSRRYQSALDLRNSLEVLREEMRASAPVPRPAGLALVLAAMLLGIGIGWFLGPLPTSEPDPLGRDRPVWDLAPKVRHGQLADTPSLSPDGEWIAYASDAAGSMDLWRVRVQGGEPERLTDTADDETHPQWSPDGRNIAFSVANGEHPGVYLRSSRGGSRLLVSPGQHPSWSPDGQFIAYDWRGAAFVVPIGATSGEQGEQVGPNTTGDPAPAWSPSGDALYIWNRVAADVQRVPLDGEAESLGLVDGGQEVASLAVSTGGNNLILSMGPFGGSKTLWAVPLDPDSGDVAGESVRLTDPFSDHRHASVSVDGSRIAFAARQVERHLWAVPLDPASGLPTGPGTAITSRAPLNYYPAISPDGTRLVWTAHQGAQAVLYSRLLSTVTEEKVSGVWGQQLREIGASFAPDGEQLVYTSTVVDSSTDVRSYQLWKVPCIGCVDSRVTQTINPIRDVFTAWSPGNSAVVFDSNRGGNWNIWAIDLARAGEPRQLTNLPGAERYPVWHPDGSAIVFRSAQGSDGDLWIMDPNGTAPQPWVESAGEEAWGAWSQTSGRFYFTSNRGGAFEVWLRQDDGQAVQVTRGSSLTSGLPEEGLYTKFAVSRDRLIVPIETRTGEIYMLERLTR